MKNIILALAFVFAAAPTLAAEPVGPAGCGLGNVFFGGKSSQVLAATTNYSTLTGVFGISSGTSNCADPKGSAKLESFVEANQVALANDAARGQGETIESVAKILGCEKSEQVNSSLKNNYERVFKTDSAMGISQSIRDVLKADGAQCAHLG